MWTGPEASPVHPPPGPPAHPGPYHSARPAFEDEAVQAVRGSRGRSAPGGGEGAEPLGDGTGRGGGGEEKGR
ncbi:hypothetical protein FNV66_19935 [Streptomyces sp. S1D4-14]|nr:hypothetical protein FNV67_20740 [Streptomyces sp. S1D4-20]QDN67547.1 hypothetical protein FNV66_19935 [Streptomyces sp. S1D4-14]QDO49958.1 hypothetical protein FNV60_18190 [Streptomyces sp. RLB3-5]QDO60197.1 hypothetical protein FNV59_20430 [Streptomyces sp. RLB1-8]